MSDSSSGFKSGAEKSDALPTGPVIGDAGVAPPSDISADVAALMHPASEILALLRGLLLQLPFPTVTPTVTQEVSVPPSSPTTSTESGEGKLSTAEPSSLAGALKLKHNVDSGGEFATIQMPSSSVKGDDGKIKPSKAQIRILPPAPTLMRIAPSNNALPLRIKPIYPPLGRPFLSLAVSHTTPSIPSSFSSSSSSSGHSHGARCAAAAAAVTTASTPHSSVDALAAETGPTIKEDSFFSRLPRAIIPEIVRYLNVGDYNRFQQAGTVPKRETGMIILSRTAFVGVPAACEYISPTVHEPGFQMPSNRKEFSFLTPFPTIPAILRLLGRTIPWNIIMFTIILEPKTLAEDLRSLSAMIPRIAIALGHAKYLVLIVNGVQFVFSTAKETDKRNPSQIGNANVDLILNVLTFVSAFHGRSHFEFCEYFLDAFPKADLHSNGLHSISLTLDLEKKSHLDFCQKITCDSKKPFDPCMKFSVELYSDFLLNPENKRLFPYLSYVKINLGEQKAGQAPFDFSKFDRVVFLSVNGYRSNPVCTITLPIIKNTLEKLELSNEIYAETLSFPSSEAYTHLREISFAALLKAKFTARLDSKTFPALEFVRCHDVGDEFLLDLSGIEIPGLNVELAEHGPIKFPTVTLGKLDIPILSLVFPEIKDILPRVRKLTVSTVEQADGEDIFKLLQGSTAAAAEAASSGAGACASDVVAAAEAAAEDVKEETEEDAEGDAEGDAKYPELLLSSAVLEQLDISSSDGVYFRMGEFLHLQHLELHGFITVLDGHNFPELCSLLLGKGDFRVTGNFRLLSSLRLCWVNSNMKVDCIAPMLTELECIGSIDATNVAIGPTNFPILRSLRISPSQNPSRIYPLPTFESDITPAWSERITVRLGKPSSFPPDFTTPIDLVKRALPDCLMIAYAV